MTIIDRVEAYNTSEFGIKYPDSNLWSPTGKFINGIWLMGNDYRSKSTLYGSYPLRYINRIEKLFPDKIYILHLFSGSIPYGKYVRFDLIQDADVNGDAEELSNYFQPDSFDIIYSDPPYSKEDAEKYGTKMINRKKVLHECRKVLKKDGFVVWLDTRYTMFTKREFEVRGFINIVRSTNHRFRTAVIFQGV